MRVIASYCEVSQRIVWNVLGSKLSVMTFAEVP